MPRIPVHTVDSAPAASGDTLRALEKRFGRVLNIHGEMAHSPVVLHTYAAIQGAIAEHGTFDARAREAIALAVGAVDDCSYCQSAHTMSAKAAGFTEEETVAIRRGDSGGDSKLDALVQVAREVAGEVGDASDAAWDKALAEGWTDTELAEVFAHVAVNLYTNYFNHYARTDLDVPAAPGLDG
ncbi:carboxymuconolactone decarboxylase family protein [Actinacidiphila sp. DG2A-62]|jgi:AhpD family alkylhydroperoxidase|uniref:carboxymuconolactone decarboxylase family protein n=1 Tax=Actinacidiphila sp. DG2A-62 TaxID=3108821 RepID=UPI002DB59445|nr:carboxymuconolactone decarboxylase family protein [Actinacidiphila sp. DG2A-62]MEC3998456.1 carboxymuconolactone decarboxylase family protein [Actinacidiphila sp. DG2A-62]